jgi:hypothetical protein
MVALRRDDFDPMGWLKKQQYVIASPVWTLNPAYSVAEAAEALSKASGKQVRVSELENLLRRYETIS